MRLFFGLLFGTARSAWIRGDVPQMKRYLFAARSGEKAAARPLEPVEWHMNRVYHCTKAAQSLQASIADNALSA